MKQNSQRFPLIMGLSIISLAFLALGGTIYSFSRSDAVQEQTGNNEEYAQENNSLGQIEKNILVAPAPIESGGAPAVDYSSDTGIPIGKYSNPPTSVNSSDYSDVYQSNRPLDNFESSVERNRLSQESSQQNIDRAIPNYSSPSSSNNFNNNNNNSLVESELENSLLEAPDTSVKETLEESTF